MMRFLILFLAGCLALSDASAQSGNIQISRDPYQGSVTVKGLEITASPKRAFTPPDTLQMWGSRAVGGKDELALYVSLITHSREGSGYRTAASAGANLKVQTEAAKVRGCSGSRYFRGGCSYLEGLWIIFDEEMLKAAAESGFSFAVYGDGPRKEFYIPPDYFAAFRTAWVSATP